ncbi:WD repeat-containing protein 44-like [Impatiens glandulifera]|uniref:WD repeat-containing protein 44-like n=1 Tax=Impatiens glandulifera TaxID=253017 RepID=UPI001FB12E8B|nr:WD repeat-containing protein 44-like [Impatiens glandulifera]
MSRTVDEEEEDERFYESLDRLLSSASSRTCSSSSGEEEEDDDEEERDPNSDSLNYALEQPVTVPRFPMGVYNNYDVWISEPSSIEERRLRLFRQMGLIRDPRRKSILSSSSTTTTTTLDEEEFGRSASYDQCVVEASCSNSDVLILRSKSDGSTDSLPEILSINSPLLLPSTGIPVNNHIVKTRNGNGNGNESTITSAASPNKPPTGKNSRKIEDIRNESNCLEISCDGEMDIEDSCGTVCTTIKDLDNGKQFVVNEIREDGMWNKLKEVGTGRQLTMEEFEMCVGHSPIVQELMRREIVEEGNTDLVNHIMNGNLASGSKLKKKGSWLKSIKQVASTMTGYKERRSSDERDTSSEKGGRRSSSATDDSQDVSFRGPERVRVRQYGKTYKELSSLYKSQEIQAHSGSIWTIKFSLDGKYLASAGEDCVIHIWQVVESERKRDMFVERQEDGGLNLLVGSPEPGLLSPKLDGSAEKKRKGRSSFSRKSVNFEPVMVPETIFALSEKPFCSLQGHLDDVLDLSWSKSQHLLSSSMDKTVRLWDMSNKSCLKIFEHNDFVTCIQFNPMDDKFFISGSLDAKVRIWSIPDHQVVDWSDLHEMVTAACYAPDGQVALVGSHKGSCLLYDTSENKLQEKGKVNLQNRKKKSHCKKITGFQFAPGSSSQVLVTSADSRIRFVDGVDLVHKFKGFRNTNSQILACFSSNGRHIVCASEDSHVYIWKHENETRPTRAKGVTRTQSYEHFHCQDVTVAIPWPGSSGTSVSSSPDYIENFNSNFDEISTANHPPTPVEEQEVMGNEKRSSLNGIISSASNSYFLDRMSATWPEEKLLSSAAAAASSNNNNNSPRVSVEFCDALSDGRSAAWGMVIVTAGLNGEIRAYQNFGLPVRL